MTSGPLCQHGRVVALTSRRALIELVQSNCARCSETGCRARRLLQGWFSSQAWVAVDRNRLDLGQLVTIETGVGLVPLAMQTYGFALAGLACGLFIGSFIGSAVAGLLAIVGAGLGIWGGARRFRTIHVAPLWQKGDLQ